VGTQAKIGWRALLALACSGTLAGFTVPAIATSLVQQEKQQPKVRLLRAPRLPSSETRPLQSESAAPPESQTGLTLSQLERRVRRTAPRIPSARANRQSIAPPHIAQGTHQILPAASAPAQAGSQTPKTTSTTTQPTTPKKNPKASITPPKKQSRATPTSGSGNANGPGGTSPGG
jgi:hypothetical protein